MSVNFTESRTSQLQVLNAKVQKWLLARKEIQYLTGSGGYVNSKPTLEAIGIVIPDSSDNKGRKEIFAGYLVIDKQKWEFHLQGRKNQDLMTEIMRDLSREFEFGISISLDDEYSREPWKSSGCFYGVIATVMVTISAIAAFVI